MDLIVEVGNTHEGSLGVAMSFVDMAKDAGAKCVKFQMHLAEFEGMQNEPFRKNFSSQDFSRQDYWKRVNFSFENWIKLATYVQNKELEFLCTPFSVEAANWLFENKLVKRWKVGSGDAVNFPLIDYLLTTNLPLIISTGLISWPEIEELKLRLSSKGAWTRTMLMHCISMYPTPLEKSSLNIIEDLKKLGCKVGLSDHSGNWRVALRAISIGIDALEVHLTPHRKYFGPDTPASLLPGEIKEILDVAHAWKVLDSNPGKKNEIFTEASDLRKIFRKGIYWKNDLDIGKIIEFNDLIFRKPVEIFDSKDFEKILGRRLKKSVKSNLAVDQEDFD